MEKNESDTIASYKLVSAKMDSYQDGEECVMAMLFRHLDSGKLTEVRMQTTESAMTRLREVIDEIQAKNL